jgi:hypothetical protein
MTCALEHGALRSTQATPIEKGDATILGIVPLNHASHDAMVSDLQSKLAVGEMFCG